MNKEKRLNILGKCFIVMYIVFIIISISIAFTFESILSMKGFFKYRENFTIRFGIFALMGIGIIIILTIIIYVSLYFTEYKIIRRCESDE